MELIKEIVEQITVGKIILAVLYIIWTTYSLVEISKRDKSWPHWVNFLSFSTKTWFMSHCVLFVLGVMYLIYFTW